MNPQDIQDILALGQILEDPYAGHTPEGKVYLIGALIEWRNSSAVHPDEGTTAKSATAPKPKRAKPTQHTAKGSDRYEPTPDPSESSDSEPDF